MKRFLSLILVVFLAVGLLAACGKDSSDSGSTGSNASNGSTDAPQGDDGIFSTEDVKYADANNESVYRVVRPEPDIKNISWEDDSAETECATYVFKEIRSKVGVSIRNETDVKDGTDVYEILIGDTNRPRPGRSRSISLPPPAATPPTISSAPSAKRSSFIPPARKP